uniref:Protein spaetzle n=1 Tax=Panagrellus redivivus TaxID=6233 RepID=A0A7E4UUP7_PANRE
MVMVFIACSHHLGGIMSSKTGEIKQRLRAKPAYENSAKTLLWIVPSEEITTPKWSKCGFLKRSDTKTYLDMMKSIDTSGHMGIEKDTLYELYINKVQADSWILNASDNNSVRFILQKSKIAALRAYARSRSQSFLGETDNSNDKVCYDRRHRPYSVIDGVKGCVLIQIDQARGNASARFYPTTVTQLMEHVKPFSNFTKFEDIYDTVFLNENTPSEARNYTDEKCIAHVHIETTTAIRLLLCVFPPNKNHRWSNLAEADYFCPNSRLEMLMLQNDEQTSTDMSQSFEPEDVAFQDICHSTVSVRPANVHNNYVVVDLTISTNMNCPECSKNQLSTDPTDFYHLLMKSISKSCPAPGMATIPETFKFTVNGKSKDFYNYCVAGNIVLGRLKPLKPCFFQQHIPSGTCTKYIPVERLLTTGGLLNNSYVKVFDGKTADCKVIFVRPNNRCHDKTGHVAVMCSCYTPFCDKPNSNENVADLIHKRSCGSGIYSSHETSINEESDIKSIACYFKTTIVDEKPRFELGFLDPKSFKEKLPESQLTFETCFTKATVTCTSMEGADFCCCRANQEGEPVCNSIEVAQNKLITSKLRASVRCSTTMNLKIEDRKICKRNGYTPRICISVFGFHDIRENDLTLTRETCDIETLRKPDDLALLLCHTKRHDLISSKIKSGCVNVFVHTTETFIRRTDKNNRVISCCSPDVYVKTRERFQSVTLKSFGDFL